MTINHRIVVHEDRDPFIRTEDFTDREKMITTIAQTHKNLIDAGYGYSDTRQQGPQTVMIYRQSGMPHVYITIIRLANRQQKGTHDD